MKNPAFNSEFFAGNRQRLREVFGGQAPIVIAAHSQLQRSGDQAYKFHQNSNFWYLTGVEEPDYVLVLDKNKDYLIAPPLSEYQELFHGEADTSRISSISGIQEVLDSIVGWRRLNKSLKLARHVATLKPSPIFLKPYGFYTNPGPRSLVKRLKKANPDIEILDIRLHLAQLRMIKSEVEIMTIRQAIDYTIEAFTVVHGNLKNYANESEIAQVFSQHFYKNGLDHAYSPIVANGKRAVTLHYEANNQPLSSQHITLIDAGANYQRYCADLTRSYCHEPTARQQAVYSAALSVQEYAIGLIKPGIMLKEYEKEVMLYMGEKLRELGLVRIINKQSVREFAPHSTSHFLGLDTHDAADYDKPLAPGMVLTVEPGIYIKAEQIGIRIEDNILVTTIGSKNLSDQLPKSLS